MGNEPLLHTCEINSTSELYPLNSHSVSQARLKTWVPPGSACPSARIFSSICHTRLVHFFSLRVFFLPSPHLPPTSSSLSRCQSRQEIPVLPGGISSLCFQASLSSNSLVSLCGLSAGLFCLSVSRSYCLKFPEAGVSLILPLLSTILGSQLLDKRCLLSTTSYAIACHQAFQTLYYHMIILQGQFVGLGSPNRKVEVTGQSACCSPAVDRSGYRCDFQGPPPFIHLTIVLIYLGKWPYACTVTQDLSPTLQPANPTSHRKLYLDRSMKSM